MFGTMTKEDIGFLINEMILDSVDIEERAISEKIGDVLDRIIALSPDDDLVHDIEDAYHALLDDYMVTAFFVGVALAKDPLSLFEPVELARLKARLLKRREEREEREAIQDEDVQVEDA